MPTRSDPAVPAPRSATRPDPIDEPTQGNTPSYGPLGRLGLWTSSHFRVVLLAWAAVAVLLGMFAPRVEHSLAGAGWEASGSQSVAARTLINEQFSGLSSAAGQGVGHAETAAVGGPPISAAINRAESLLRADPRVSTVIPPAPRVSISSDQHTAVIQAGAAGDTNTMVRAADALAGPLNQLSTQEVSVTLPGSSALWSDCTPQTVPP